MKKINIIIIIFGIIIPIIFYILFVRTSIVGYDTFLGFLGGYIGGFATLIAVIYTIEDNNKHIIEKKVEESNRFRKEREFMIKPYLDTNSIRFSGNISINDRYRYYEIDNGKIERRLIDLPEYLINIINDINSPYILLEYNIRNIGSGAAINVNININGFNDMISISKDEKVSLLFIIKYNITTLNYNILIDYWDCEDRVHYYTSEKLKLEIADSNSYSFEINDKIMPREYD